MAPRKRITNGATSKGKVTATTEGKAYLPTNNQSHTKDTDSISPQELSVDVQSSQQQEDKLLHMLYEMRKQMKEQQLQSDHEQEQMCSTVRTSFENKRS